MSLADRWQLELNRLHGDGRLRTLTPPAGLDFSSNDYLAYSRIVWPDCNLSRSGTASRLLRGHHPIWDEVELKLAAWHGTEAAVVLTSGYVANEGLLSTVVEAGDLVFSDRCNHASIIDGLRLSRAEKIVFAHNNVDELASLLRERHTRRGAQQAWFIVTESLFGM
ncbi:MAG TPA: aminotransferase class I/II-fold pyridoxal phosphate-dependent enzyme, partial [Candidatus Cybelea sp.]|nr:aminotransferase class I/II-fold pyridoxal phosphate-dependent enzyme [Candidatus Cybelea sp.]